MKILLSIYPHFISGRDYFCETHCINLHDFLMIVLLKMTIRNDIKNASNIYLILYEKINLGRL